MYVRVVETLYVARQLAEAEVGLHAHQCTFHAGFGIEALLVFEVVDFHLTGIACRYIQQLSLVAALRYGKAHAGHIHLGYQGYHDFVEHHTQRSGYFGHGVCQHLGLRFVEAAFVAQCGAAHHGSAAHVHIVHVHVGSVVVNAEYVDVANGLTHDYALAAVLLDELVRLFQQLCFFEAQFHAQSLHFAAQIVEQFLCVTSQYLFYGGYEAAVFLGRNQPGAAAFAAFDVVLQTQSALAGTQIFGCNRQSAGSHRI